LKIRVLVVDDDEDLLFLANKFLEKEDNRFELVAANTDQEALQKLEEEEFDAIVCDHYLGPHSMTGLDLLEWVREANPNIPFIILTGRSQEAVAIRALNLGADYYLKKGTDEVSELFSQIAHKIVTEVEQRRSEEALELAYDELEKRVAERTAELEELNEKLVNEIEERKKIEQSLLLQQELGNVLCRTSNITDALDMILKTAVQLDGVDSGGIYLVDSRTGNIDLSTSQGLSAHFLQNFLRDANGKSIRCPVYLSERDLQTTPVNNEQYKNLTAAALIPVLFEDNPVAFLSVASSSHAELNERERHTLEAIAVQISAYMARVMAENSIQDSRSEIEKISDILNDYFLIVDSQFGIIYANKKILNLFGHSMEQLSRKRVHDLFKEQDKELLNNKLQRALEEETESLPISLNLNGTEIQVETKIRKGRHDGQDVLFILARSLDSP
jgi:PAS domain S-box-containing protein